MRGWKLVGLRPRTLLSEIGFKSGDVLVSVNGKELPSLSHVASILTELKGSQKVQIEILRRGSRKELKVTFEGPPLP